MDPAAVQELLNTMISRQREKVLGMAREVLPHLTPEDIRNPQDFPELLRDPLFNYEDGILTGYLGVESAIRTERNQAAPARGAGN